MPTISANLLVKNEERWIWYAIMAILNTVDELIIGDTGSTDNTVQIIRSIQSDKVKFTDYRGQAGFPVSRYRQEQIDSSTSDWIMIVDGDELWTPPQLQELRQKLDLATSNQTMVATRFYNCIGDIYHYQADRYAGYKKWDIQGNVAARLFRRSIPGLSCQGPYGVEGFYDGQGHDLFAAATREQVILLENRYLHATYLVRSNTLLGDWAIPYRRGKFLNILGTTAIPKEFTYPSSFTLTPPKSVRSPFQHRSFLYFLIFGVLSQLAYRLWKFKRHLISHRPTEPSI